MSNDQWKMIRFSRNQIIGGLVLLVIIWVVALFRMLSSRA
jgi:hypothetical protein